MKNCDFDNRQNCFFKYNTTTKITYEFYVTYHTIEISSPIQFRIRNNDRLGSIAFKKAPLTFIRTVADNIFFDSLSLFS